MTTQKRDRNVIGNGGAASQGINPVTQAQQVEVINQERFGAVKNNLEDNTNLTATTHYFPSSDGKSLFGFSDVSFSGKLIVSAGAATLTLEEINDEDLASGDWIQNKGGYRVDTDTTVAQISVTSGTITFKWDFDSINADRYRLKLVLTNATNTVIIKERVKP